MLIACTLDACTLALQLIEQVKMDSLIKRQTATAGYIERFWENIMKAGKEKATRCFMKVRLELLENYWVRFADTHEAIVVCDKVETTDYMRNDVYGSTVEKYLEMKFRVTAMLLPDPAKSSDSLQGEQLPCFGKFSCQRLACRNFRESRRRGKPTAIFLNHSCTTSPIWRRCKNYSICAARSVARLPL